MRPRAALSDQQQQVLDSLQQHGEITVTELSVLMGRQIRGEQMSWLQVKVLELGLGKVRRRREGRQVMWSWQGGTT